MLFEKHNDISALFRNQQDLVVALLSDTSSEYYCDSEDSIAYGKAMGRLKTYLSQLLSSTVNRTVTENFKSALLQVISKKIGSGRAQEYVDDIIADLRQKNSSLIKVEGKNVQEELRISFNSGNYIVIATARPLEIEASFQPNKFTLRGTFLDDFFESFNNVDRDFKKYRFNFPLESTCDLFWTGFRKRLKKHLAKSTDDKIYERLHAKFTLNDNTIKQIGQESDYKTEHLDDIVTEIIVKLNQNRSIVVFACDAPIYSVPVIAINPAEKKNSRVFVLLDSEEHDTSIQKLANEDAVLWRLFVWDRMRAKKYEGKNIEFSRDRH